MDRSTLGRDPSVYSQRVCKLQCERREIREDKENDQKIKSNQIKIPKAIITTVTIRICDLRLQTPSRKSGERKRRWGRFCDMGVCGGLKVSIRVSDGYETKWYSSARVGTPVDESVLPGGLAWPGLT